MKKRSQKLSNLSFRRLHNARYSNPPGNVLLYVVVLMLIFGVLGVVMVSLFTSSTASTVTQNDTRRAIYMAESGMRYAFSELREADFDIDFMIDTLNTTTYTVTDAGSFTINVFGPWFDADGNTANSGAGQLPLVSPIGTIPSGYLIPPTNIYAINYEFTDLTPTAGGWAPVSGIANQTDTTITLNLADDFYASPDERVSLAVRPKSDQPVIDSGNLIVFPEAQTVFPKYGGAISIRRNDYFYEERIDDPDNNRVIFRNLSKRPEAAWGITAGISDFVILSPRNYMVAPTGKSDNVEYGGDYLFGKVIYDASQIRPGSRQPDITADDLTSNLSEQETDSLFFDADPVADELTIGGGGTNGFGSAFYVGDESIGGNQDYCEQGACLFALGVRAFFLLNFTDQGDGITFTLLGKGFPASKNTASSVGGDFQLSELLGYAGDSRLDAAGSTYVATDPNDRGLDPPKIAVEFDTRTNNTVGDPPPDYCSGPNVNSDTRNDPVPGGTDNKDAVQYVFWGRENFLDIPCRGDSPLYDDNRHDAFGEGPTEQWRFGTGGPVSVWRPGIGPDGTIYVSDQVDTLYALDEDGSTKWTFNLTDGNEYMPGVDRTGGPNDGTIYSDIFGSALVAINPDGTEKWRFTIAPAADINSTPTVGPDGVIYFGTAGVVADALFAINPNGTEKWLFLTAGPVNTVPALSPDASAVYAVSNDNFLYAVNTADGIQRWRFPMPTEPNEITSSPVVNPSDGTIYVGSDPDSLGDSYVYALNPAARTADPNPVGLGTFPQPGEWRFGPVGEVESSAALDPNDGTIYIGSDDSNVYAINPNGTLNWRFPTGGAVESSPIVDVDGTVYVGSSDNNVYALKPAARLADPTGAGGLNATAGEWAFATGSDVPSSPALGKGGFIHIGSDDTNFYTISQYADPRNFRDANQELGLLLTSAELDSSVVVDDTTNWLNGAGSRGSWAVRLEVDRALLPDVDGKFDYELRLWIRQCSDQTDIPCSEILGTFYQDTRIEYDYTAVNDLPMRQRFRLSGAEQDDFERFFFGFTGAAGAEALNATISQFQLSFIRPGDPVIDCDRLNWPLEDSPPLPDCLVTN